MKAVTRAEDWALWAGLNERSALCWYFVHTGASVESCRRTGPRGIEPGISYGHGTTLYGAVGPEVARLVYRPQGAPADDETVVELHAAPRGLEVGAQFFVIEDVDLPVTLVATDARGRFAADASIGPGQ